MPLFDRYIAVDWSAANSPRTGKDSIWIGEATAAGLLPSRNPSTRAAAMADIEQILIAARSRGERVMLGFDFCFGYPRGTAMATSDSAQSPDGTSPLVGEDGRGESQAPWAMVWAHLTDAVTDSDANVSNRFEVAAAINRASGPRFWGHPQGRVYDGLGSTRDGADYSSIAERRHVESRIGGPQPVWKLYGSGSVGSQTLLGIPRLEALRNHPALGPDIAVWPFETDFDRDLSAPVILVEIYPSYFAPEFDLLPLDRDQVETCVSNYARMDREGTLGTFLSAPADLDGADREIAVSEEGWIAGVGHGYLKKLPAYRPRSKTKAVHDYLRDPDAIYAKSFATIEAEADLARLPSQLHPAAIRMIHACGMVDLAADIVGDPAVVVATRTALAAGAPVLCDCEMVRSGVIRRYLPESTELVVTLNDPVVPELARSLGTTRSAAAVELWRPRLGGAIVLIGNAPTVLFHLIEMIEAGAPRPAAIIAAPVGFVGAAESKALLASGSLSIAYLTVLGRRGGSAIASAAFNAISRVQ